MYGSSGWCSAVQEFWMVQSCVFRMVQSYVICCAVCWSWGQCRVMWCVMQELRTVQSCMFWMVQSYVICCAVCRSWGRCRVVCSGWCRVMWYVVQCAGVEDGAELYVLDGAELCDMLCSVQELRMVQSCVMCYAVYRSWGWCRVIWCVVCRSSGWCSVVWCAVCRNSGWCRVVWRAGVEDGAELCYAVCRSSGQCRVVWYVVQCTGVEDCAELCDVLCGVQEFWTVQSCVMCSVQEFWMVQCCAVCRSSGWCSVQEFWMVQCAGVLDGEELCDVRCAGVLDGAEPHAEHHHPAGGEHRHGAGHGVPDVPAAHRAHAAQGLHAWHLPWTCHHLQGGWLVVAWHFMPGQWVTVLTATSCSWTSLVTVGQF